MAKKKTAGTDATDATPANGARRRTTTKRDTSSSVDASAQLGGKTAGGTVNREMDMASDRESVGAGATEAHIGSAAGYGEGDPSYEQIAEAAYQRYLRRGGEHGRDFDDWVEAERELRERR